MEERPARLRIERAETLLANPRVQRLVSERVFYHYKEADSDVVASPAAKEAVVAFCRHVGLSRAATKTFEEQTESAVDESQLAEVMSRVRKTAMQEIRARPTIQLKTLPHRPLPYLRHRGPGDVLKREVTCPKSTPTSFTVLNQCKVVAVNPHATGRDAETRRQREVDMPWCFDNIKNGDSFRVRIPNSPSDYTSRSDKIYAWCKVYSSDSYRRLR